MTALFRAIHAASFVAIGLIVCWLTIDVAAVGAPKADMWLPFVAVFLAPSVLPFAGTAIVWWLKIPVSGLIRLATVGGAGWAILALAALRPIG